MRNKQGIILNSLIAIGIIIFIAFYIIILTSNCVVQRDISPIFNILLFSGFIILIIGVFIAFNLKSHNRTIQIYIISENLLKLICLFLMIISFILIPPITFSSVSIAWLEVNSLNIFRAIIFVIGGSFLPGACLYNIFFHNLELKNRLKADSILIKLTFYPILSFIFLGIVVLIFDQIGFNKELITICLIFALISFFLLDIALQHIRNQKITIIFKNMTISNSTLLILFLSLGAIFFSLGIILNLGYLIPGDSWQGLSHVNYIGVSGSTFDNSWLVSWNYPIFWSYPSFALSSLSGLPYININVLMTPFIYLFGISIYLFNKAILKGFKEIYPIISTILTITFTGLLSYNNIGDDNLKGNISNLIFDGLINFRFKSFGIILFFAGLTLIFIQLSQNEKFKDNNHISFKTYKILGFGALFFIVSYITYMFPLLFAMIILIIYCLFMKTQSKYLLLKNLLQLLLLMFCLFFLFDISMDFYPSRMFINYFYFFFRYDLIFPLFNIFSDNFIIYLIFFTTISFFFILYLFFNIIHKKKESKLISKKESNSKLILVLITFFLGIFSVFLITYIISIFDKLSLKDLNNYFLFFFLNEYFFPRIGIIGIISIFLSYFAYKSNKNLFLILIIWIFSIFLIASIFFLIVSLSYFPNIISFSEVVSDFYRGVFPFPYNHMRYWFTRTWYYTIPAFSILLTIALKEIIKKLKHSRIFEKKLFLGKLTKNVFISFFIAISFTNLITAGLYWQNLSYHVKDEEAQVIGWVTENVAERSRILIDAEFEQHLIRTKKYFIYDLRDTVDGIIENYINNWCYIAVFNDSNCNLSILNDFEGHQNILKFDDQNNTGRVALQIIYNIPQQYGTLEFFIYSTNISNRFWVEIENINTVGLYLCYKNFNYYNGSDYIVLQPYIENRWYHVKLNFELTNGSYKSLNQYEWNISINDNKYDHLKMFHQINQIESITFKTAIQDSDSQIYLDPINFSLYPNNQIDYKLFSTQYMEKYLKSRNIIYYIHTSQDSFYKRNFENEYFNIQDFIDYHFPIKIYEYGYLSIYKKNQTEV